MPELVAASNLMGAETKSLDTSMQNLVYENYNKFISATDTIREMKESVASMDARMQSLVKGMEDMTESSAVINGGLQDNRSKVEKLVGVRRLLKKLEFLFELPVRLNRSIELEAYSQAVKYYNMASGVLRKYGSVPSLHAIRVEADDIMDRLRASLRKSLAEQAPDSGSRVIECIRLLVTLKDPRPGLRDAFLSWQKRRLKEALAGLQRGLKEGARTGPGPQPHEFIAWVNAGFVEPFVAMADTYCSLFEDTCSDTMEGVEERRIAHLHLVAIAKELFAEYFDFVKRRLSFPQCAAPLPSLGTVAGAGTSSGAGAGSGAGSGTGAGPGADAEAESGGGAAGGGLPPVAPPPRFASIVTALYTLLQEVRTAGQCVREARLGDLTAEAVEAVIRLQVGSGQSLRGCDVCLHAW